MRLLVHEAVRGGAEAIVHAEGDELSFVPRVDELVAPILQGRAEVTLGVCSPQRFAHLSRLRLLVERRINACLVRLTGVRQDHDYGPCAYSSQAATAFAECGREDSNVTTYPTLERIVRIEAVEGEPHPHCIGEPRSRHEVHSCAPPGAFDAEPREPARREFRLSDPRIPTGHPGSHKAGWGANGDKEKAYHPHAWFSPTAVDPILQ